MRTAQPKPRVVSVADLGEIESIKRSVTEHGTLDDIIGGWDEIGGWWGFI